MTLGQDLRFAFRLLIKGRWYTLAAIIALALGIGANVAVFTIVNAILIRDLPFRNPDQIVMLSTLDARGRPIGVSFLDYLDYKTARTFSHTVFVNGASMTLSDDQHPPEQTSGAYVSVEMFDMIGQRAVLGRDFRSEDGQVGAPPVAILSDTIWKNRFGAAPDVIGQSIRVNGTAVTVIGVMPEDVRFPFNTSVWVPESVWPQNVPERARSVKGYGVIARIADGTTLEQARAELATIGARMSSQYPENKGMTPFVDTMSNRMLGPQARMIFLALMGAVVFVLLIACANVANLLLARASHRAREISIRFSLGATRGRVVRQLLVESVLLSALGGIAGFGLALAGIWAYDNASQFGRPYDGGFTLDPAVLAFFAFITLATGVIFGIAPALQISKTNLNEVLKEGGRTGAAGGRARRWAGALIVVELALTLVLLAGAGFMMRSFLVLFGQETGIDSSRLLTMRLQMPVQKYNSVEDRALFLQRVDQRLTEIGGIEVGATASSPPMQFAMQHLLVIDGRPPIAKEQQPIVGLLAIGPRYFDAVGAPLIRGRIFNDADGLPGSLSAIVSQRFVSRFFPDEDPLGRRIQINRINPSTTDMMSGKWVTIVGVAPTIRQQVGQAGPGGEPEPIVYFPHRSYPQRATVLVIRTRSNPAAAAPLLREEVRKLDPEMPLFAIITMDDMLAQGRSFYRTVGSMFAIFAFIALVLSAVGLYAVTAYSVTQRTQEIGVRMALGAQAREVQWLFVRRGLVHLAIGLAIGFAGAIATGRLLQSMLVRTSPTDPATLTSIAAVLITVALAACYFPARRATRLNPVVALRYE